MRQDFLIFGQPVIEHDEIAEVVDSLRARWLGTGPKVARFEADFAAYIGAAQERVAAVNSCTAGLHLSMVAADLEPGDEVVTTAMTFCATVNSIIHAGATPVLVDVEPQTFNLDPEQLRQAITPRTRAILPVHFAGRPCDMARICATAEQHGLMVIEDCAHAIESEYHGQRVGSFGEFGCFSFYATKNVTTGEGGMVVGRSAAAIDRIKTLALHGLSRDAWHRFSDAGYKHYFAVSSGYKYNMMDLQAAIGIHQLKRIEDNWHRRVAVWDTYQRAFAQAPVVRPAEPEADTRHSYHLYTLLLDEAVCGISRDRFLDEMTRRNIGTGVHYLSVAEHPFYQQRFGWRPEQWPEAHRIGQQTVSLPLSPGLSDRDVEDVVEAVGEAFA